MSYFEESVKAVSEIVNFDASSDATIPGANRFVTLGANGVTLSAAEDSSYGVLTGNFEQGQAGRIAVSGIVPVVLSATVAKGAKVGAGANGTATGAATKKLGFAVLGGNSGDIVPVRLELTAA